VRLLSRASSSTEQTVDKSTTALHKAVKENQPDDTARTIRLGRSSLTHVWNFRPPG